MTFQFSAYQKAQLKQKRQRRFLKVFSKDLWASSTVGWLRLFAGKLKMAREQRKICDELRLVFHGLGGPWQGVTGEIMPQGMPKGQKCNLS